MHPLFLANSIHSLRSRMTDSIAALQEASASDTAVICRNIRGHAVCFTPKNPQPLNGKMRKKMVTFKRKDGTVAHRAIYNKDDVERQAQVKYNRVRNAAQKLPKMIADLNKRASAKGLTKDRMAATALIIMQETGIRPGNKRNKTNNRKTFGLTTLQARHVKIDGDDIQIRFRGKAGQSNTYKMTNRTVAMALREMKKNKATTDPIFRFAPHSKGLLLDGHLRDEVKRYGDFKPKDLRTAAAYSLTEEIGTQLKGTRVPKKPDAAKKALKAVVKRISKHVARGLNNLPATALKNYIDPTHIRIVLTNLGFNPDMLDKKKSEAEDTRDILRMVYGDAFVDDWIKAYNDDEGDDREEDAFGTLMDADDYEDDE